MKLPAPRHSSTAGSLVQTLLLTGHRKSGTTLLHRLFDGHPTCIVYPTDLAVLYAYLPCFASQEGAEAARRSRIEHVLTTSLAEFDGSSFGPMTERPLDVRAFCQGVQRALGKSDLEDAAAIFKKVTSVFREAVGADSRALLVVKETSQAIHFDEFDRDLEHLRILSIVRDPRDNFAAIAQGAEQYYSRLGEDRKRILASFINRARMDLMVARDLPKTFETAASIRFEDLTRDPASSMNSVAEWLGVQFRDELVQPTRVGRPFAGNNHGGKQFAGISSEHVGAWRHRTSLSEIGVIEFWLADVMTGWEYKLSLSAVESRRHFSNFYRWYNCNYFYFGTAFDLPSR